MENTRALFLIDKSDLSDKNKEFLKTHIGIYDDKLKSLMIETMRLKDIIEWGRYLDNEILSKKEDILSFVKEDKKKEVEKLLNSMIS